MSRAVWTARVLGKPPVAKPVKAHAHAPMVANDPAYPKVFALELDLPPKALSSNVTSTHKMHKARSIAGYRRTCMVLALQQKPRDWKPCAVVVDVEYRCSRKAVGCVVKDEANALAALKAGFDGALVDAGIAPDDSARWVKVGRIDLIPRRTDKGDGVTLIVRKK